MDESSVTITNNENPTINLEIIAYTSNVDVGIADPNYATIKEVIAMAIALGS